MFSLSSPIQSLILLHGTAEQPIQERAMELDPHNLPTDVAEVLSDFGIAWTSTGAHHFRISAAGNKIASIEHAGLPEQQYGVAWETLQRLEAAGSVELRYVPEFQLGHGLVGTVVLTEYGIEQAKQAAKKTKRIEF